MDNLQEDSKEPLPDIVIRGKFTCMDNIPVKMEQGLCGRPSASIVRDICREYDRSLEVFFEKEGNRINARSIMGLMTLEASINSRLDVLIETPDNNQGRNEARRLALRIYSGLTSNTDFYPSFDRFEGR